MPNQVLDLLRNAVDAAAATFNGRGSEIRERELEMAIEAALLALGSKPLRQVRLRLEEAWSGRVGGVDLGLNSRDGSLALIELKWDSSSLAACAWDSMKLAAALQAGEGQRAFLVAGSPSSEGGVRGDELLDEGAVTPAELRQNYASEFDYWKTDVNNHPKRAPAGWQVLRPHSAPLEFKQAPWRIRLAELRLTSSELVPVE